MYDLKWFKLGIDVFNDRRLKYCLMEENGLYYQLVWIKLLCEAAKINDGGKIYIVRGDRIDIDELAFIIDMPELIVCEALDVFECLGMIKYSVEEGLVVIGWNEYIGEDYARGGSGWGSDNAESSVPTVPQESAEAEERRVKIKDMSEQDRREYYRLAKRKLRGRERSVEKRDVQNVQNANNSVQNPVGMSKNSVQNVQNECPKILDNEGDNVQNSPKNIFIEENREEENRIDKSIGEENGEEKINNNSPSPSQRVEEKKKYGTFENVYLSDTELEELRAKLGVGVLARLIDDLSEHIASTGKTYASHHATLLRWSKNQYAPREEGDRYAKASSRRGEEGAESGSDGWDFANRKGPRDAPREPKNRYGDFDPEEAFRLALERTRMEYEAEHSSNAPRA